MMQKLRRLRKLRVSRVDLVPAGANPGARIELFKAPTKTEDGKDFPAGDYAYMPDPESPSTWKLRLTSTPGGGPDARIVGAAVAALGRGFRGQKVQIPSGDLSAVKRKVLTAWLRANPDADRNDAPEVLKMADENKTAEDLQAEVEAVRKQLTEVEAERDAVKAEAEKAAGTDGEIRKTLDDTRAELAEVRKRERQREFVEKARMYSNLGSVDRLGRLLAEADEHFSADAQADFHKLLRSASEQVEKGALFERLSKDGEEIPATWEDRLAQAARDRVAKGTSPTIEQAKVAIMREDAELRKEYEAATSVRS